MASRVKADYPDIFTVKPLVEPGEIERIKVDANDPVAICELLAEVEHDIAIMAPQLGYAAGRVIELKAQIARTELSLWPQAKGELLKDREAAVKALMEAHPSRLLDYQVAAEAHSKMMGVLMQAYEKRMSILQSMLKRHTNQQFQSGVGQGG
jgi:multidrug efflux pump subunit AcrA (membrane-fusion protein)